MASSVDGSGGAAYQSSGMLSRNQLLHLFDRFSCLTSQPDVKKRIAEAFLDKQVNMGSSCCNHHDSGGDLFGNGSWEEMACEEAELGPEKIAERMLMQQKLLEQQLEMLKYMRNFHLDDQSVILEKIHQHMEKANFETEA